MLVSKIKSYSVRIENKLYYIGFSDYGDDILISLRSFGNVLFQDTIDRSNPEESFINSFENAMEPTTVNSLLKMRIMEFIEEIK